MVVAEQKAAKISKQTEREVKSGRNEKRKENEKQTEANTAAIAEEAGTVASEARAVAERATTDAEVRNATEKADATLEKVNNQLALLGYYEADKVDKDFNETYGYLRDVEKKAVKDAAELAERLADDLGIDIYEATHSVPGKGGKRKSKPLAVANIAPIGGDITIHLPLADGKDLSIYINLKTTSAKGSPVQGDSLEVGNIMYRIEKPNATGHERYGGNNFAAPDITYDRLRDEISRVIDRAVRETPQPKKVNVERLVRELQEKGKARLHDHTEEVKEKPAKKNSPKKKSVSLKREPTVGDLFGDLFDNNDSDSKDNDTARTRQAGGSSQEDGTVGRISAERDGVLDTRSAGGTDGGGTAGVPDTAGTVADGERKDVSGQRGGGSALGGNHGDGEIAGRLPYGGRGVGNGAPAAGRNGHRGSAAASAGVQDKTGSGGEGVRHGMQADGRPSSDPGGDGLYTPAAERPSPSGTAGNRREVQGGGRRELEPGFKRNYLYPENSSEIDNMTPQQRLRSNVEALEIVRTLMKEGRESTADEREILGRYCGWGGVDLGRAYSTDMMRGSSNGRWGTKTENDKLLSRLADIIDDLDPDGKRGVLSAINHAALTSYYTPTVVARVMMIPPQV